MNYSIWFKMFATNSIWFEKRFVLKLLLFVILNFKNLLNAGVQGNN